jgi:anti-sigma regulatory factor (Ser/Thr protein kinase)
MNSAIALPIAESSQVGEARRQAVILANQLGFNETDRGKISLTVTEAANNLLRHAGNGTLLLQAAAQNNQVGIEILALDKGPGMENVTECMRDGFSTAGTPGNGLGAIRRLATQFDIYSTPRLGTALLAQFWLPPIGNAPRDKLEIGGVCLPIASEEVSGDAWAAIQTAEHAAILAVDGLGHGPMASAAALEAVRVFRQQSQRGPKDIIELAHTALHSTRGAALAIAEIDFTQKIVRYAGIGNIASVILSDAKHAHLISYNGTVGHEVRKIQEFTYPWDSEALLIMHSDGLGSQWNLDRYVGLASKHPSLIAGVLYRDFNRGRDDVTVIAVRQKES